MLGAPIPKPGCPHVDEDEPEDEDAALDRLLREFGFPPSPHGNSDEGIPPNWDDLDDLGDWE